MSKLRIKTDKCSTPYCRNKRAKGRSKCFKCNMTILKERHPITYWYNIIKQNAKRRGKPFLITKEDFKQFCEKTNYLELKGKNKNSMSIDCIINEKGYVKGNIRMLSLSENSIKRHVEDFGFKKVNEECPF